MKRALAGAVLVAGAVALVVSLRCAPPVANGIAVRGVALGLFASTSDYDYGPMIDEIAARGATDVLVVVPWYQTDVAAHDMAPRPGYSPADDTIEETLRAIAARGMRPALMPIVRLQRRTPSQWRGVIDPAAGAAMWFDAYRPFIVGLAEIAARTGTVRFYVGSELSSLERHDAAWRRLVTSVRARFGGGVSYASNWDRFEHVPFWDAVDEIGVTGYVPLAERSDVMPSLGAIVKAWQGVTARIDAIGQRHDRPIVLTEIGYPSRPSAAVRPWDDAGPAEPDLRLQARLYDGFCAAWAGAGVARGFYAWNWFGVGGPRDTGFTPRGKPAAARLEACLRDRRWDQSR